MLTAVLVVIGIVLVGVGIFMIYKSSRAVNDPTTSSKIKLIGLVELSGVSAAGLFLILLGAATVATPLVIPLIRTPATAAASSTTSPDASRVSRAPTTDRPSTNPPAPTAKITSPQDGSTVAIQVIAEGTSAGIDLGSGNELWIVVIPAGTGRLFPQQPAATISSSGDWTATDVFIGRPADKGRSFLIEAVAADRAASESFRTYFALNTTSFPGLSSLPEGATLVTYITVTRG